MAIVKATVDEQLIRDAKKVLDIYDIDMEKAIQLFLDEVVKTKGIAFLSDTQDGEIDWGPDVGGEIID